MDDDRCNLTHERRTVGSKICLSGDFASEDDEDDTRPVSGIHGNVLPVYS
jgi:hypothetical protein